jgi:seryl-tRNA synthetase
MPAVRPATVAQAAFRDELVEAGLLIPSGVPGVLGRGAAFEAIRAGLDRRIDVLAAPDGAEALRFPPVLPRRTLEDTGYLASFPHLAGTIFAFEGDEASAAQLGCCAEAHEDPSPYLEVSELALTPAACYPVYPAIAARGPLAPGGIVVDAGGSWVFRHEPSDDPSRLQMFHQREIVRLGEPDAVAAWRDSWRDRCVALLTDLELDAAADVANDPFFGRSGRMLAKSQRAQALKFEVAVPIGGDEPTAVASFNYHREHFADRFGLVSEAGGPVHTACLGFGLERIVLALLFAHGLDAAAWPAGVRAQLDLDGAARPVALREAAG